MSRKRKKKKTPKKNKKNIFHAPLPLDAKLQKKFKSKAIQKLNRSVKSLDEVEQQKAEFNDLHSPSYDRWFHKTFSPELSALDALQQRFNEKRRELLEFQEKAMLEAMGLDCEEEKESVDKEEQIDFEFGDEQYDDPEDEECDCPFCRASRRGASAPTEEELEEMLADAFEDLSGESPYTNRHSRRAFEEFKKEARKQGFFEGFASGEEKKVSSSDSKAQLLFYYRLLVRKLHPDKLQQDEHFKRNLWHQVQEAYQAKDVSALHHIWAMSCIGEKKQLESLPVSDLIEAAERLKSRTKHLRKELRRKKRLPAWGFAHFSNKKKSSLQKEIKQEFQATKRDLKYEIKEIELIIEFMKNNEGNIDFPSMRMW